MPDPITLLVIRDPDSSNEYVSDGPVSVLTLDVGASWTSVGEFGSCLVEGQEDAIEYEQHMLGSVAHLDELNPVRIAVHAFFYEARLQGGGEVCQSLGLVEGIPWPEGKSAADYKDALEKGQ